MKIVKNKKLVCTMKTLRRITNICIALVGTMLAGWCVTGCNSDTNEFVEDPYFGGREAMEVKLLMENPLPNRAYPKDEVTFYARGLAKYIHQDPTTGEATYDFNFYISDSKVETIVAATDSTVTILVPDAVSSGTAYMELNNQVFYGPKLTILGSVSVDEGFVLLTNKKYFYGTTTWGTTCFDALPRSDNSNQTMRFYLAGDLTQSGSQKNQINSSETGYFGGIGFMDNKGNMIAAQNEGYKVRHGGVYITGLEWMNDNIRISSLNYFNKLKDDDGLMMLASGTFSRYEMLNKSPLSTDAPNSSSVRNTENISTFSKMMKNIVILRNDCRQPVVAQTLTKTSGGTQVVRVPEFNGGTNGTIVRSFVTSDDKIIAVGNFNEYSRVDYSECLLYGKDNNQLLVVATDAKSAPSAIRMESKPALVAEWGNSFSGALDESYRVGIQHTGTSEHITDASMNSNDEVIIVGKFSSFDGIAANNIVKLDANGNVDSGFLSSISGGANGRINMIRYNKARNKALIVGEFTEIGGVSCPGIAMIDGEGHLDTNFKIQGRFEGGTPTYAEMVDLNGIIKIVVAGSFTKYDKITRRGFLLLNEDGDPDQRFNVPGRFMGQIYKSLYSRTSEENNGLLLLGDFSMFDDRQIYNAVMLEVNMNN